MVVQVLLPGHHMAGLREEEEATEIRVQEVEEGCGQQETEVKLQLIDAWL
jgi:hypothetical protein